MKSDGAAGCFGVADACHLTQQCPMGDPQPGGDNEAAAPAASDSSGGSSADSDSASSGSHARPTPGQRDEAAAAKKTNDDTLERELEWDPPTESGPPPPDAPKEPSRPAPPRPQRQPSSDSLSSTLEAAADRDTGNAPPPEDSVPMLGKTLPIETFKAALEEDQEEPTDEQPLGALLPAAAAEDTEARPSPDETAATVTRSQEPLASDESSAPRELPQSAPLPTPLSTPPSTPLPAPLPPPREPPPSNGSAAPQELPQSAPLPTPLSAPLPTPLSAPPAAPHPAPGELPASSSPPAAVPQPASNESAFDSRKTAQSIPRQRTAAALFEEDEDGPTMVARLPVRPDEEATQVQPGAIATTQPTPASFAAPVAAAPAPAAGPIAQPEPPRPMMQSSPAPPPPLAAMMGMSYAEREAAVTAALEAATGSATKIGEKRERFVDAAVATVLGVGMVVGALSSYMSVDAQAVSSNKAPSYAALTVLVTITLFLAGVAPLQRRGEVRLTLIGLSAVMLMFTFVRLIWIAFG